MVLKFVRLTLLVLVVVAAWTLILAWSPDARADSPQGAGDLFYNYYVPQGPAGGVPAEMYPSPRPTPPSVGHTYMTYQPLYPQEFLYQHHRVYYRCNPGAGETTTRVSWRHVPTPIFHLLNRGGPLGPSQAGGGSARGF